MKSKITLTERQFRKFVSESVNKVLKELDSATYAHCKEKYADYDDDEDEDDVFSKRKNGKPKRMPMKKKGKFDDESDYDDKFKKNRRQK